MTAERTTPLSDEARREEKLRQIIREELDRGKSPVQLDYERARYAQREGERAWNETNPDREDA